MSDKLVEAVAREICKVSLLGIFGSEASNGMIDEAWQHDIPQAKAAIAAVLDAIAEPSDAQRIAGRKVLASQDKLTDEECAASAYRAMIAALRSEMKDQP